MEKRINNILFLNGVDGIRKEYHVLFTHHNDALNKDYAVFVNIEDEDDVLLFSYDENKTLSKVTKKEEIEEMINKLKEYDQEMSNVIYEDESIMLSKFTPSMYEDIHLNSLEDDNRRFVPDEVFETMEQTKEVVDFLISCYEGEEGPFAYAIIRKSDLKNVGYVQLVNCGDFYEIGYHIAKKYTGQGLATRAVKLFLKCLKEKTNLKELYGICLKENSASARVLEKTGFKKIFEGLGIYQGEEREIIKTIIDIQAIQ